MGEIGIFDHGGFTWDPIWRRSSFVHDEPMVAQFFSALKEVQLNSEFDKWI